jgi:hypothetical protein
MQTASKLKRKRRSILHLSKLRGIPTGGNPYRAVCLANREIIPISQCVFRTVQKTSVGLRGPEIAPGSRPHFKHRPLHRETTAASHPEPFVGRWNQPGRPAVAAYVGWGWPGERLPRPSSSRCCCCCCCCCCSSLTSSWVVGGLCACSALGGGRRWRRWREGSVLRTGAAPVRPGEDGRSGAAPVLFSQIDSSVGALLSPLWCRVAAVDLPATPQRQFGMVVVWGGAAVASAPHRLYSRTLLLGALALIRSAPGGLVSVHSLLYSLKSNSAWTGQASDARHSRGWLVYPVAGSGVRR